MADERRLGPEQRKSSRFRYAGVIFLAWVEAAEENFVMGRCLDISLTGLGVEIVKRIPVGTQVRVRAEWINLDGSATVRHVTPRSGVFHLGLELKQAIRAETLAELLESNPET